MLLLNHFLEQLNNLDELIVLLEQC
ncbi:hypothetical protein A5871_003379, partial [Enterococcus sp. 2F9_DIV0599]